MYLCESLLNRLEGSGLMPRFLIGYIFYIFVYIFFIFELYILYNKKLC